MGSAPFRKVLVACYDDPVALRILDDRFGEGHEQQRVHYLQQVKKEKTGRYVLIMSRAEHVGSPVRLSGAEAVTKQYIPPAQRDKFDVILVVSRTNQADEAA